MDELNKKFFKCEELSWQVYQKRNHLQKQIEDLESNAKFLGFAIIASSILAYKLNWNKMLIVSIPVTTSCIAIHQYLKYNWAHKIPNTRPVAQTANVILALSMYGMWVTWPNVNFLGKEY
jgi:hypothetical protein